MTVAAVVGHGLLYDDIYLTDRIDPEAMRRHADAIGRPYLFHHHPLGEPCRGHDCELIEP